MAAPSSTRFGHPFTFLQLPFPSSLIKIHQFVIPWPLHGYAAAIQIPELLKVEVGGGGGRRTEAGPPRLSAASRCAALGRAGLLQCRCFPRRCRGGHRRRSRGDLWWREHPARRPPSARRARRALSAGPRSRCPAACPWRRPRPGSPHAASRLPSPLQPATPLRHRRKLRARPCAPHHATGARALPEYQLRSGARRKRSRWEDGGATALA